MRFFTKKTFLIKLIISLCIICIMLGTIMPNISSAWSFGAEAAEKAKTGGKLIEPVVDLMLGIGDAVINIIQSTVMGTESAVVIDTATSIILAVLAAAIAIAVVGITAAVLGPLLGGIALLKIVAGAVGVVKIVAAGVIFSVAYTGISGAVLPEITLIPTYSISPEEIFRGEILLFDVNIFNPKEVYVAVSNKSEGVTAGQHYQGYDQESGKVIKFWIDGYDATGKVTGEYGKILIDTRLFQEGEVFEYKKNSSDTETIKIEKGTDKIEIEAQEFTWDGQKYEWKTSTTASRGNPNNVEHGWKLPADLNNPSSYSTLTQTNISATQSTSTSSDPDATTASNVPKLEAAEFFSVDEWKQVSELQTDEQGNITNQGEYDVYKNYVVNYYFYYKDGNSANDDPENKVLTSVNNSAMELKETVAKWYYALRTLAIVALMIVLLYIGIQIIITTTSEEKAKYKKMLVDWVVALCLIFVMQYIMVFANQFTEALINLFSGVASRNTHVVAVDKPHDKLVEGLEEAGYEHYITEDGNLNITTNLMGKFRMLAQEQDGTSLYVGYAICFLILVLYTMIFAFVYAKRLLWMIFLTIISPLVAVSYPIDKIGDGKSQAFDMWLKEYLFNLIIQPFHLLLYVVLISTAYDLAGTNVIYSLVAIGFMIPAEKFLRKMFGFDQASTPGFLGGAAGAAVAMTAVSKLGQFASKGGKGKTGSKDGVKMAKDPNETSSSRGADSGRNSNALMDEIAGEDKSKEANKEKSKEELDKQAYEDTYEAMFGKKGEKSEGNEKDIELEKAKLKEDNSEIPILKMSNNNSNEENSYNTESPKDTDNPISEPAKLKTNNASKWLKAKARVGNMKNKMVDNIKYNETWHKAAKEGTSALGKVGKIGVGLAGAGLGATIGIASGDVSNVIRNTSAGAYAGASIAKGTGGIAKDAATSMLEKGKEAHADNKKKSKGSDEYSKYKKAEADKQFRMSKANRDQFAEEFEVQSKAEIDRLMEQAIQYRKEGIEDNKLIIKAMKLDKDNPDKRASAENRFAAMMSKSAKTQEDFDKLRERIGKQLPKDKTDELMKKIQKLNKDENLML